MYLCRVKQIKNIIMKNSKQIIIDAPEGKVIDMEHFSQTGNVRFIDEKPEQKRIIELSDDGETWFEATSFIPKCEKLHARVRVETQPTKRLPTIEEVEKWFLENRVFMYKKNRCYTRITIFDKNDDIRTILIGTQGWISIYQFCERYNHYDGTELYITEN